MLLLALLLAVVGCSRDDNAAADPAQARDSARAEAAAAEPVDTVKILVDQAGLIQVTADDLSRVGFDLNGGDAGQLSLSLAGEPVAFVVDDGQAPQSISFYGQPRSERYARTNVYWLGRSGQAESNGAQATARSVSPPDGTPVRTYRARHTLEEAVTYLSHTPQDTDHWLGEAVIAPGNLTLPFDLPDYAGGDADLALSLWGNTEHAVSDPDHHAILRVNGQQVADVTWDGKGWHTIEATMPAAALQATGNELTLELPGDTGAPAEMVYLDRVDFLYSRQLRAREDRLQFTAAAGQSLALEGFQSDDLILWDVTDARQPQPLEGFQVETDGDGMRVSFRDANVQGERTYLATARGAQNEPLALVPHDGTDLRDNATGADYIAVVYPGFEEALQPLVDLRRSQGLRVTVATIDEVYDSFSHGLLDPAAIRDFMRYARDNWPSPAPRFLLLVGDATYDFQGFLDGSTPNLVPTYLLTTRYLGETASDNWFVSLGDDQRPGMAVGRIPAQTAAEVETAVAKTLAYENAADAQRWAGRALFVSDNEREGFQDISNSLADEFLPASYEVEKIYVGKAEDPNAEIISSLGEGVGLVTYVGHGSIKVWTQDKIFQIEDIPQLDNGSALPFMMTMTCLVGYFHHPELTSMGELLLFEEDGGVVAALVPTSESLASDQRELAENIFTHLFDGETTVGEAIMVAKQTLPEDRAGMQDLIETFTLLGDPALILHQPAE